MTQPGGRICGLPSRYRTYLRCSPILCAADALSVAYQLAVLCLYHKHRFAEAVGTILHERFNIDEHSPGQQAVLQDGNDEEAETVHLVEAMTWLRWLWFILGTLPPAIKLMSMSGVRWPQAWGMMFLNPSLSRLATNTSREFLVQQRCISEMYQSNNVYLFMG
jgi:hypothetical protein